MPIKLVGYFDLTGPSEKAHSSKALVQINKAEESFIQWKNTLKDLVSLLKGQAAGINIPRLGEIFNLSKDDALEWIEFFLNNDEVFLDQSPLRLIQARPRRKRQGDNDGTWWSDDLIERLFDRRLVSTKSRKRGLFIPGARRSPRTRNAQFMRIRVPHK